MARFQPHIRDTLDIRKPTHIYTNSPKRQLVHIYIDLNNIEIHFVENANEILKKAFTSKITPYKEPKDKKMGMPEKPINPKENTLRH